MLGSSRAHPAEWRRLRGGGSADQRSMLVEELGVLGHLEGRALAVLRGDDRQDLPIDLLEPADQQVAPGADAADHVRVGAFGGHQNARPAGAGRALQPWSPNRAASGAFPCWLCPLRA